MALDNLISIEFSAQEIADLNAALSAIEAIITPKAVNLTEKQRQQYGRVKYEMEVWVNKASNYMSANPSLVPSYIDTREHDKDIQSHNTLNPIIDRLEITLRAMSDTNLLLGTDLYNNCMAFYRAVKMAAQSNAVGANSIYNDLKQQFPGPKKKGA